MPRSLHRQTCTSFHTAFTALLPSALFIITKKKKQAFPCTDLQYQGKNFSKEIVLCIHQISCIPFSSFFLKISIYIQSKLETVSMYFPRHHGLFNLHQTRLSSGCMDRQTYSILSSERSQLFYLAGYESSRIQHVLRRDSALRLFTSCSSRSSPMVDIH